MAVIEFHSRDHKDLLDLIDKLRASSVNQYVALPKIVVVGDQSTGKSSVLEAISGMSFPAKDNLCTRFATELVLRRSTKTGVKISIIPAASCPVNQREVLRRFCPVVQDGALDLSHVVDEAKSAMGINASSKAFSEDILRVEISGPEQPHLTMVDLPGLFQAGNSMQSDRDSETVTRMVLSYMERPRSIILAVVSAKSDFALQKVTRLARGLDPNGNRTIGLITKPDTLDEGSESEAAYIRLAKNEDVRFKLGWHVLKNRDYKMTLDKTTSQERDDAEEAFFSKGPWETLDRSSVGIRALKPRLSCLLRNQILIQLPHLAKDVEDNIKICKEQLEKLGFARENADEQRRYLIHISQTYSELMKAAVEGFYHDPFFGSSQSDEGYHKRLRAVIQRQLTEFNDVMTERGCRREIIDPEDTSYDADIPLSEDQVLRSDYIKEVGELINRNRGCELPGTFNPLIVGELFFDQCKPWEGIAQHLLKQVLASVYRASHAIVHHVAVESTATKLEQFINSHIQALGDELNASFKDLLQPYQKIHAITYDEALTDKVQQSQAARRRCKVEAKLARAYPVEDFGAQKVTASRQILLDILTSDVDVGMKLYGTSLAVDYLEAYYNLSLKKFIDDTSALGVECCLLQKLRHVFEPREIYNMDEKVLQHLAAEDMEAKEQRSALKEKQRILSSCLTKVV
ncbi:interferon-induced GTP-binding protein Mx [Metarhizium rileyi]|uniref:Interferon-induced GTP-binding protein Mx n=1 Tax=Metarhizium rileyi (strain RCEF 4871) TaxID=1649241 RepID=A0A167F538_METRR|nr:interferon-induced GTP-binding protein Mx [Metarhizium rileyi RCEF 4871]